MWYQCRKCLNIFDSVAHEVRCSCRSRKVRLLKQEAFEYSKDDSLSSEIEKNFKATLRDAGIKPRKIRLITRMFFRRDIRDLMWLEELLRFTGYLPHTINMILLDWGGYMEIEVPSYLIKGVNKDRLISLQKTGHHV